METIEKSVSTGSRRVGRGHVPGFVPTFFKVLVPVFARRCPRVESASVCYAGTRARLGAGTNEVIFACGKTSIQCAQAPYSGRPRRSLSSRAPSGCCGLEERRFAKARDLLATF
jgi:hypothetical protein